MKKIIALALTVLMCVAVLTSCSFNTIEKDPEELAKIYEEKEYCEYKAVIDDSEESIQSGNKFFDVSEVYCVVSIVREKYPEKTGYFFYCNSNKAAKDLVKAINEHVEQEENLFKDVEPFIVEREGNIVFAGCEYAWAYRIAE